MALDRKFEWGAAATIAAALIAAIVTLRVNDKWPFDSPQPEKPAAGSTNPPPPLPSSPPSGPISSLGAEILFEALIEAGAVIPIGEDGSIPYTDSTKLGIFPLLSEDHDFATEVRFSNPHPAGLLVSRVSGR